MRRSYYCSNPECGAVHADDPHGHCPTCIQPNGGGWSCVPGDPSNLTQRLRNYRGANWETTECFNGLRDEAAGEIERLQRSGSALSVINSTVEDMKHAGTWDQATLKRVGEVVDAATRAAIAKASA